MPADDLAWAGLSAAGDPALVAWLADASCDPHVKALVVTAVHASGRGVSAARWRRELLAGHPAAALTDLPGTGAPDDVYAAVEAEFPESEIAALTFAIVAIDGWNRLAVGLRPDVLSLDGLDVPDVGVRSASGSAS